MRDVGIVMPIYNQIPSYLQRALKSVLEQIYPHFQLVIVIDGANNKTIRVAKRVANKDPRVHWIVNKKNQGITKALNSGFKWLMKDPHIRYLTWVSSDNFYYKKFISTLRRNLIQSPPQIGLVYSGFRHIKSNGKPAPEFNSSGLFKYQDRNKEQLLIDCFIGPSFMYKKTAASKIAGYRRNLEPVEDYDYWLRLTEHADIKYVAQYLMDYRVNSSHSISKRIKDSPSEYQRWLNRFHQCKFEARFRRRLKPETTIIFSTLQSNKALLTYKSLLDQWYEDYRMLVLDHTPNHITSKHCRKTENRRVRFLPCYGKNNKRTIRKLLPKIKTKFVFIYNSPGPVLHSKYLFNLTHFLNNRPSSINATSPNKDELSFVHENKNKLIVARRLVSNHLYRTSTLKRIHKI
ncbi:Glycosyltransferase, GT2 family [Marininema mesophilum]|uniref:Glycosyltransferase, GT2 family n=1 Tax=Marininema mesophilum TaxID=1048340 RepID=A0A1H3CNV0_9BACL|nr:glycosyltransferase [Marininema mesophilum]SDX55833.1 Glycosyltransferase, GT2 family [Marininema mesophilum]